MLDKYGLNKDAMRMERLIADKSDEIRRKADEITRARDQLVRHMLLAFSAGDIATVCADKMAETFDELTYGQDRQGGNELAKLFREQAEEWNKCVQMVDGNGESERVSMYYADMAEEIVGTVIPVIYKIVDKYMNSKDGERLL